MQANSKIWVWSFLGLCAGEDAKRLGLQTFLVIERSTRTACDLRMCMPRTWSEESWRGWALVRSKGRDGASTAYRWPGAERGDQRAVWARRPSVRRVRGVQAGNAGSVEAERTEVGDHGRRPSCRAGRGVSLRPTGAWPDRSTICARARPDARGRSIQTETRRAGLLAFGS